MRVKTCVKSDVRNTGRTHGDKREGITCSPAHIPTEVLEALKENEADLSNGLHDVETVRDEIDDMREVESKTVGYRRCNEVGERGVVQHRV